MKLDEMLENMDYAYSQYNRYSKLAMLLNMGVAKAHRVQWYKEAVEYCENSFEYNNFFKINKKELPEQAFKDICNAIETGKDSIEVTIYGVNKKIIIAREQ